MAELQKKWNEYFAIADAQRRVARVTLTEEAIQSEKVTLPNVGADIVCLMLRLKLTVTGTGGTLKVGEQLVGGNTPVSGAFASDWIEKIFIENNLGDTEIELRSALAHRFHNRYFLNAEYPVDEQVPSLNSGETKTITAIMFVPCHIPRTLSGWKAWVETEELTDLWTEAPIFVSASLDYSVIASREDVMLPVLAVKTFGENIVRGTNSITKLPQNKLFYVLGIYNMVDDEGDQLDIDDLEYVDFSGATFASDRYDFLHYKFASEYPELSIFTDDLQLSFNALLNNGSSSLTITSDDAGTCEFYCVMASPLTVGAGKPLNCPAVAPSGFGFGFAPLKSGGVNYPTPFGGGIFQKIIPKPVVIV